MELDDLATPGATRFREDFNSVSDSVRLVTQFTPTSPIRQHGQVIVQGLFEEFTENPMGVVATEDLTRLRDLQSGVNDSIRNRIMPTSIAREKVQRLMKEEAAQLVEVLPSQEYRDEHIAGAINLPLKRLNRETTSHLDKVRPIIVY